MFIYDLSFKLNCCLKGSINYITLYINFRYNRILKPPLDPLLQPYTIPIHPLKSSLITIRAQTSGNLLLVHRPNKTQEASMRRTAQLSKQVNPENYPVYARVETAPGPGLDSDLLIHRVYSHADFWGTWGYIT